MTDIECIDLNFNGRPGSIAAYLIPHPAGAVLVDAGPGSSLPHLRQALSARGFRPDQVTHVLLTHIHLDHAGTAGWFARQGARILVHPFGAPHLVNPERLLASARRIYGDRMEEKWGEFLPVPAERIEIVEDDAQLRIGGLEFRALHTPGHAEHHICYAFEDVCFTGDVGGVRKPGPFYVRLPFVPPETHLRKWRTSLERIRASGCTRIAVTHFGIHSGLTTHVDYALQVLDSVEKWMAAVMPEIPDGTTFQERYIAWLHEEGRRGGFEDALMTKYDVESPVNMGAAGLFRYWQKESGTK
jgi:glyoxylase-like metal-dependent hydrolase (beta-lactamase superfamily II)